MNKKPRHEIKLIPSILLVVVIGIGVVLYLTRTTWQEMLASHLPQVDPLVVVTPLEGEVSGRQSTSPVVSENKVDAVRLKAFFSTEKKYVYVCGWTAQAGTLYPDGTVYEIGMLDYSPEKETRANAGYGTWFLKGNVLMGSFGPVGNVETTLKEFTFKNEVVLSDTAQPHEDCTYLFASSYDALRDYTKSLDEYPWGDLDFVYDLEPNENSATAPMDIHVKAR
jgi:hypothetical protein